MLHIPSAEGIDTVDVEDEDPTDRIGEDEQADTGEGASSKNDGGDEPIGPAHTEEAPTTAAAAEISPKAQMTPTANWRDCLELAHLSKNVQWKTVALLENFQDMWSGRLGRMKSSEFHIHLKPGTNPASFAPHRAGPQARKILEVHIKDQIDEGFIESATSKWASPVLLTPKKGGSMRFCVDFRRLNMMTIADTYRLSRMEYCIDSLGDATVFFTLDANWVYLQLPIAPADQDKTTFTSHVGIYRYTRLPFGFRNAQAAFQKALDIILSGVKWRYCLVYLDDIIVVSKSHQGHLGHLDSILSLLRDAGVTLKLIMCSFVQERIDFLGHVILPVPLVISQDAKVVKTVRDALYPQTLTQMKSFLGAVNVYRRFIKGFPHITSPLTEATKKDAEVDWDRPSQEQLDALQTLKYRLASPPVLTLPVADRPFMIDTDASAYSVGAVLLQQQDPKNNTSWATVAYY